MSTSLVAFFGVFLFFSPRKVFAQSDRQQPGKRIFYLEKNVYLDGEFRFRMVTKSGNVHDHTGPPSILALESSRAPASMRRLNLEL